MLAVQPVRKASASRTRPNIVDAFAIAISASGTSNA
jgi:hypothetical protein